MDHSYSQAFVRFKTLLGTTHGALNVSIEYSTSGLARRGLDLVISAVAEEGVNASDFAVAFAGSFAWDRVGTAWASAA